MEIHDKIKELFLKLHKQGDIPQSIKCGQNFLEKEIDGFKFRFFYDCGDFDYIEDIILPCGAIYDPCNHFTHNDIMNGHTLAAMMCWTIVDNKPWIPEDIKEKQ